MLSTITRHLRRNLVAYVALFFGLAGTSFGAATLIVPPNSVGTKQLKKNAVTAKKIHKNAVGSLKVKDDSLSGNDISEQTLGKVPAAGHADSATSAGSASNAGTLDGVDSTGFVRSGQAAGGDLVGTYPNPTIRPSPPWRIVGGLREPQFQNGWHNINVTVNTAAFYKDALGIVRLRGLICCGTTNPIFTLPKGYRPANNMTLPAVDPLGANDFTPVNIADDGKVYASGTLGGRELDAIAFRAEK